MIKDLAEKKIRQIIDEAIKNSPTILEIRRDLQGVKQEQSSMRQELQGIKQEQSNMRQELHRQGIILEDIQNTIKLLAEAVTPLLKKSEEMSDFDRDLKDQNGQIKVTQKALRSHIKDKKAHPSITE